MLPNPHTGNMSSTATYRNDPKPRQVTTVINAKPNGGTQKSSQPQTGNTATSVADALNKQYGRKL